MVYNKKEKSKCRNMKGCMPIHVTFDEESGLNCYIGVPGKELPPWAGVGGLVYAEVDASRNQAQWEDLGRCGARGISNVQMSVQG